MGGRDGGGRGKALTHSRASVVVIDTDAGLQGCGYAKAPFDAACWDIPEQSLTAPFWLLPGGKLTDGAPMYQVAPQKATDETIRETQDYRKQGYRQFQIRVGADRTAEITRIRATVPLLKPGETAMAQVVHFAAATQPEFLQNPTDRMNYNTRSTGNGGPIAKDGKLFATDTPGLGVSADFNSRGVSVEEFGR